jgi:hypothetical protein
MMKSISAKNIKASKAVRDNSIIIQCIGQEIVHVMHLEITAAAASER